MFRITALFSSLLFASCFLSSCLQTRGDIAEQEEKQKIQSTVTNLQRSKADQEAKFDAIELDLRQLNGKIEAVEHRAMQPIDQARAENAAQNKKIDELVAQMKIFDETLLKAHQRIDQLEKEGASRPSVNDSKPPKPAELMKDADEMFAAKDWKRAIAGYQKFRETNPKGKEMATATFRIGVCFQELGMKTEARSFYEEVLEKFPKDATAKGATIRLRQLKK